MKSRDFVNLRCWHLCRDGIIVDSDSIINDNVLLMPSTSKQAIRESDSRKNQNKIDETTDDECILNNQSMRKSNSEMIIINESNQKTVAPVVQLSKSLGARSFYDDEVHSGDDDPYMDAESETPKFKQKQPQNVYVSAAVSLVYAGAPIAPKYIRGENLLSCWAMQEIDGNPDSCIFEWLLCLDLKGFVPRYVLESVRSSSPMFFYIKSINNCFMFARHTQHLCKIIWSFYVNIAMN